MPAWMLALVFAGLAAAAAWGLRADLSSGVAGDDLYRFRADDNPTGYAAIVVGKLLVIAFGLAEIAHALGLLADPLLLLRRLFG